MLRNYAAQNTETSPNPPVRKSPSKKKQKNKKMSVSVDSRATRSKNLQRPCAQQKIPHPEIRQNPLTLRITKTAINQFATQIN